ncbi:hypothetical protein [Fundicoccus culcitae]|uniref:Uncharacterized protein n=1 Tax=Fundicoccus culcitae TaxID=2969821 RepID=A0ABY5P3L5_9LACT|nr:hypothetical protein [Fundicoccus culcitae]UUX33267.1 hypothetical protein NRE15_10170 [Fundicoccus culcitae]
MVNYISDFTNTNELEEKSNHLCVVASVALIFEEEESICLIIKPERQSIYGGNYYLPYITLKVSKAHTDKIANVKSFYGYGLERPFIYLEEEIMEKLNSHEEIFVLSRRVDPFDFTSVWALDFIASKALAKEIIVTRGRLNYGN